MKSLTIQILNSYWKRPLIQLLLLLLVLLVLTLAALAVFGRWGKGVSIGPRPRESGQVSHVFTEIRDSKVNPNSNLETISQLRQRIKPEKVQSLSLVCLNVGDPLPDLSVLPNLRYLKVNGFKLTMQDIDHLCALPQLDALVIEGVELPPGALPQIGNKVSELQLMGLTLEAHHTHIAKMTKVKRLAVYTFNASPKLIEYITEIPNMEVLTLINAQPDARSDKDYWHRIHLSEEDIASLKSHSKLKEVYADWSDRNALDRAQMDALLPLRAFPTFYADGRLIAINLSLVASFLVFVIVALQLWVHFMSPAAVVVPNYLSPQRNVGLGVLASGLLLIFGLLVQYDFALLPSLCIVLYFPAACCLYSYSAICGKTTFTLVQFPLLIFSFLFFGAFTSVIFPLFAGQFIWFFRGNMPFLTSIAIVISFVCIALMFFKLRAITEMVNEKFPFTPPFSFWDAERAQQRQIQQVSNSWMFRRFDVSVSNLSYRGDATLQMVHLWRSGNLFRPIFVLGFMGIMVAGGGVFHLIRNWIMGESLFDQDWRWVSAVFSAPFSVGLALPALAWWQRRNSLEAEFLKPVARHNLIKQLYLSLALDHWIVFVGAFGSLIYIIVEGHRSTSEILCLGLFLLIIGPLWMLGTSMSVLIFKESWKAVAVMIGLYLGATIGGLATISIAESFAVGDVGAVAFMYSASALAIVVVIGLNAVMYRAALRREWG